MTSTEVQSHILSIDDLSKAQIDAILSRAAQLDRSSGHADQPSAMQGRILATVFFQPSTRTQFSFQCAALRMGGKTVAFSPTGTRAGETWGESLSDTARVLSGFVDMIVIRHPDVSAVAEFAAHSRVPVINAGNGSGLGSEHPSQALLDLYTIKNEFGQIEGRTILFVGGTDMRCFRSQIRALRHYSDVSILLLCPDDYWMPPEDEREYRRWPLQIRRVHRLQDVVDRVDVIYHNGFSEDRDAAADNSFFLDADKLRDMRRDAIVLHSMPRTEDLNPSVDDLPQARYFEQADNGLPTRIALIEHVIRSHAESARPAA